MGLFGNVKKAAIKTKLQGELLLIDREVETLQKKSGGELFTVLYDWDQQQHVHSTSSSTSSTNDQLAEQPSAEGAGAVDFPIEGLSVIYHAAKEDIMDFVARRQAKVEEMDVVEVKLENAAPATTAKEKARNAKEWVSQNGSLAKLKAEVAHLEREINIRKEIFGVQVLQEIDLYNNDDAALQEKMEAGTKGQKQQQQQREEDVSFSTSSLMAEAPTATEEDIFALLHRIKVAMDPILERKRAKQEEIAALL